MNIKKSKIDFTTIIQSMIISYILFFLLLPAVKEYFLLFGMIWLFILVQYSGKVNEAFYSKVVCISLGNLITFVIMKYFKGGDFRNLGVCEYILAIMCLAELCIGFYRGFNGRSVVKEELPRLFDIRKYDLERVKYFIQKAYIVGIEASWGEGKTVLVEHLVKDKEIIEQYEIIRIDLLTCKLDEVENTILGEVERVLKKNHILAGSSRQLKRMLSGDNNFLTQIRLILFDNEATISDSFTGVKQDINKLEKSVLIIYDDIERIEDEKIIKKIFAISEKLAGKRIRFIYQYSEIHMPLEREEIEKYIPHIVYLTQIPFETAVKGLWDEANMSSTVFSLKDISEIAMKNINITGAGKWLPLTGSIKSTDISIRKIRLFLEELYLFSSENTKIENDEDKKIYVGVMFVRNFMYDVYRQFEAGRNIEETLTFKYQERSISLKEMFRLRINGEMPDEDLHELFEIEENRRYYVALGMLNYSVTNLIKEIENEKKHRNDKDDSAQRTILANQTKEYLRELNHNEKINRFIWNSLGNGNSEYSDMKAFVECLVKDVLSETENKKEGWERLNEKAFHGNIWKTNKTLFRWGIDNYNAVFQALCVIGVDSKNWCSWLEFYFQEEGKKGITVEMIECLNYCNCRQRDTYIKVLELFSNCREIGNLNEEKSFSYFLSRFVAEIRHHGYADSYALESWCYERQLSNKAAQKDILQNLEAAIESVEEEIDRAQADWFITELKTIAAFLKKCIQIIEKENAVRPVLIQPKISVREIVENQAELERLKGILKENPEEFQLELEKSYRDKKISPRDVRGSYFWNESGK